MFKHKCSMLVFSLTFCIIFDTSKFVRGNYHDYCKELEENLTSKLRIDIKNCCKKCKERGVPTSSVAIEKQLEEKWEKYLEEKLGALTDRILEAEKKLQTERNERENAKVMLENFEKKLGDYSKWKKGIDKDLYDKGAEIDTLKKNMPELETKIQTERNERIKEQENFNGKYLQWKRNVNEEIALKMDISEVETKLKTERNEFKKVEENLKSAYLQWKRDINDKFALKMDISKVETDLQTERNEWKKAKKRLKTNIDDIQNISITLLSFDKNFKELQWNLQILNSTLEETYRYFKLSEKELNFYGEWRHEVLKDFSDFRMGLEAINGTAFETKTYLERYIEAHNSLFKALQNKTSSQMKQIMNLENNLQTIHISMKTLFDNTTIILTRYEVLNQDVFELTNEVRNDIEPRVLDLEDSLATLTKRLEGNNQRRQRYVRSIFPKKKTESTGNSWLQK